MGGRGSHAALRAKGEPLPRIEHLARTSSAEPCRSSAIYSFMGYLPDPREMIAESVPGMVARMRQEQVDAVLLVPV
jgi:hypothetical protein